MGIVLFPFKLIWGLIGLVFNLTGRLICGILGLVFLILGLVLCITLIGAVVGIPLIFFGILLSIKSLVL